MEWTLVVLTLVGIAAAFPDLDLESMEWEAYKDKYEKHYSQKENDFRKEIWQSSRNMIRQHNTEAEMGLHSYTMGINQFTDRLLQMPFGFNLANTTSPRERQSIFVPPSDMEVPDEVDWTKEGLVTHVKNQWLCGSCWAFSATGALEGQVKKATGQLISLSVQQLIDCDKHDKGCHGGLMDSAYDYIKEAGGIESSDDYSYWSMHLWCRHKKRLDVAHVKGYTWIPEGDEEALKKAVATIGPIAVALNAKMELQYYRSGVYSSSHCPGDRESLNHGVLIVGYGEENGVPYWLIKNSWGKWWGQRGYMKLKRNVNMCGIANYALYPLV